MSDTTNPIILRVDVPATPPKEATKNSSSHWAQRYRAVKQFRETCGRSISTLKWARGGFGYMGQVPDTLDLSVWVRWPKGQRRFDDDGIRSALSGFQDELFVALDHVSDHRYRVVFVEQTHAKEPHDVGMTVEVRVRES